MVSSVESFYATNKTYVGAASDQDVQKSGVFGTGNGEADIVDATSNSYKVVGKSASGNLFTISKSGSTVTRDCTTNNKGGCPSSGNW